MTPREKDGPTIDVEMDLVELNEGPAVRHLQRFRQMGIRVGSADFALTVADADAVLRAEELEQRSVCSRRTAPSYQMSDNLG